MTTDHRRQDTGESISSKTILIISQEFPPNVGGIGNHAYNLAKALSDEGYDVTVMADIMNTSEAELSSFTSKQNFQLHWIQRRKPVFLSYLNRITSAIKLSAKADKIICTGKFPLWLGIIIRSLHPAKQLIAVVHGSELDLKSSLPRQVTFYAIGGFNKIISVSKYTQQHLPKQMAASVKQYVVHNGIKLGEFKIITEQQTRNNEQRATINEHQTPDNKQETLPGHPALITIGSVTQRKGQENVINAMPDVLSVYPSAQYHVIGKPIIAEQLKKQTEKLKLNGKVHFYGALKRREMLEKLSGTHIKLMLSNHTSDGDFEGFGISILEANAFGIPAIGSKDSGIADAIEHEKTGLLINQYDAKEVVNAISAIMNNYEYYSANAKAWATQHDWKKIVKEYIAVLDA